MITLNDCLRQTFLLQMQHMFTLGLYLRDLSLMASYHITQSELVVTCAGVFISSLLTGSNTTGHCVSAVTQAFLPAHSQITSSHPVCFTWTFLFWTRGCFLLSLSNASSLKCLLSMLWENQEKPLTTSTNKLTSLRAGDSFNLLPPKRMR